MLSLLCFIHAQEATTKNRFVVITNKNIIVDAYMHLFADNLISEVKLRIAQDGISNPATLKLPKSKNPS